MQTTDAPAVVSKKARWTGYVLSALPSLLLIMSAVMKLARLPSVIKGFEDLGLPAHLILGLGVLELTCTAIYLFPLTSILGAILLTGYLGGAVLTHLRLSDPSFVMPAVLGVFVWGGLFLREPRLRPLIPLRRPSGTVADRRLS